MINDYEKLIHEVGMDQVIYVWQMKKSLIAWLLIGLMNTIMASDLLLVVTPLEGNEDEWSECLLKVYLRGRKKI